MRLFISPPLSSAPQLVFDPVADFRITESRHDDQFFNGEIRAGGLAIIKRRQQYEDERRYHFVPCVGMKDPLAELPGWIQSKILRTLSERVLLSMFRGPRRNAPGTAAGSEWSAYSDDTVE